MSCSFAHVQYDCRCLTLSDPPPTLLQRRLGWPEEARDGLMSPRCIALMYTEWTSTGLNENWKLLCPSLSHVLSSCAEARETVLAKVDPPAADTGEYLVGFLLICCHTRRAVLLQLLSALSASPPPCRRHSPIEEACTRSPCRPAHSGPSWCCSDSSP